MPVPSDSNYGDAWKSPIDIAVQNCNSCHASDPFIHSRWIVGAKMPNNPNEAVLPEVAIPNSKYCVIGNEFSNWDLKHIDIPGNNCLSCHRLSNINAWNFENNTDWDLYMPPNNPGSMSIDYQFIKDYIQNMGAFEIDENSRNILSKNAIINKVRKRISIYSEANLSSLKNNLKKRDLNKTLFLLDIEGNEFDLFNLDFCKYFSQSYFIVEDHSFLIINKKKINSFYKNIYKYFKVEIIKGRTNDPLNHRILDNFTEDEKYLMMSEGRPMTMQWILLTPRKNF